MSFCDRCTDARMRAASASVNYWLEVEPAALYSRGKRSHNCTACEENPRLVDGLREAADVQFGKEARAGSSGLTNPPSFRGQEACSLCIRRLTHVYFP
jgi:hypothetical protein